jgi:hypothetical protein
MLEWQHDPYSPEHESASTEQEEHNEERDKRIQTDPLSDW